MNNLNLARKWRPKTFDEIIGQDISVRMIKNSLYLNKLFPVYLFAGQRGCGKTSMARVFAAAINCHELSEFRKNPKKYVIPCMHCDSCKNIRGGRHPDFIEMDAASHTGVDSVRQIIESCSYMPVSGGKKIYLIDEAHMLSKAAFNAFLKILEEPPESVVFILATTEMHKIPDTVRSRCFQAFFNPVGTVELKKHLLDLCKKEDIVIDEDALDLMLQEAEGSVRDALNILERIRFLNEKITKDVVLKALGKISDEQLLKLMQILLEQKPKELLQFFNEIKFFEMTPKNLWTMLVSVCRNLLWLKYEVENIPNVQIDFIKNLKELAGKYSINRLNSIMQLLWSQEELFLRTPNKHLFLETVLLQICQQVNVADLDELIRFCKEGENLNKHENKQDNKQNKVVSKVTAEQPQTTSKPWGQFLKDIEKVEDQLLISIFKQAHFIKFDPNLKKILIQLKSKNAFFVDKINDTESIWMPMLQVVFPNVIGFEIEEISEEVKKKTEPVSNLNVSQKPAYKPQYQNNSFGRRTFSGEPRGEIVDVSDATKWPTANLLTKYFSGTIEKVCEKK